MKWSKQLKDWGISKEQFDIITESAMSLVSQALDGKTGEYMATKLAELVANDLEQWQWLDDPDHPLWDICADICTEMEDAEDDFEWGDDLDDEVYG